MSSQIFFQVFWFDFEIWYELDGQKFSGTYNCGRWKLKFFPNWPEPNIFGTFDRLDFIESCTGIWRDAEKLLIWTESQNLSLILSL